MNYFGNIIGNSALTDRLSEDISGGFLSHAYILEGPDGSGRHTVALTAAATLSCLNRSDSNRVPCGQCINCRKIFSGQSPDIVNISLGDDKTSIGIDAIRKIKSDICTAPNDLNIKVYIIDGADYLTVQAQNAFLLTLEEPPSYVLFFLICENSSLLLDTVKSRAPVLRTERLDNRQVEKYILENDKRARELLSASPDDFKTLLCVSAGSIGYALELLDAKKRNQVFDCRKVAKDIISMLTDPNKKSIFDLIVSMGNKRQEIARQLVFLQFALRDLILLKKSDNAALCFFEDREYALERATHFTSKSLIELYDASCVAIDDLDRNANVRLTLMNMMQSANLI